MVVYPIIVHESRIIFLLVKKFLDSFFHISVPLFFSLGDVDIYNLVGAFFAAGS